MLNKYKYLNLFFYRFAQILLVEGILAFVIGLFYLIIVYHLMIHTYLI